MPGEIPRELDLIHEGCSHRMSLLRGADKVWSIELDGQPWGQGRRVKQGEWYVYHDGRKQRGRTLETAATTMFYWINKDRK